MTQAFTSAAPLAPGFLVVHANLPEQLRALVVNWTKAYPLGVFETETVLVQSNGIAQWLKLALAADPDPLDVTAGGAGIASGLSLQMPGRFIWQLYRTLLPAEAIPEQSGFDKNQLRWRLFRLLPELATQPGFAVIQHYLAKDPDQTRLQQLAFKLADLFDQYQVYRADWLQAFANGFDLLPDHQGQPQPMPDGQAWQAALWRAVMADVPVAERQFSRATLHQTFLQAARTYSMTHRPAGLPRRVMVFGISSLPQQVLEALAAIAPYTQVLLAVHNPCQHYWADIIADKELLRSQTARQHRKAGMPVELSPEQLPNHAHPLLAAWGKQGRDYIRLLDEFDQTAAHRSLFAGERIDLFSAPVPDHLLAQLQNDILELRPAAESASHWPALTPAAAQTLCFATAHSAMREVEILHDDLLAQFAADPQLKPADIMVMVPDIHLYAPAISAVFGRLSRDDARYIPFTIADQAAIRQEPLLLALQMLLQLRQQRFTLSAVLDLLQLPAIQQKFGFAETDIPLLRSWMEAANIRWGLDSIQRESLGLPADFEQNSWHAGIQRMLLGYAIGTGEPWQGIAPCEQVSGLSAGLAGQLAQFIGLLRQYWQQSAALRSPDAWQIWLRQLLADFFLPTEVKEQTLLAQLQQALDDWLTQCQQAALTLPLQLSVVQAAWLESFSTEGLAQRFLAGAVNFATLMPMRAIPFAQIHLLGMNDGEFPRQTIKQDFDLMAKNYRPGDRSRRDDDRYLFLEALLSARDRLRISWVGHSVHDNSERAPSVLVGQLRDHLAQCWRLQIDDQATWSAPGPTLLQAITVVHPLQPFSKTYLQQQPALFSYQHEWLALYQPASEDAGQTLLTLPEQLPQWELARLTQWLKDPVRFFFRERLNVSLELTRQQQQNSEDFSLDGLSRWQLQHRLQQQVAVALRQQQDFQTVLQGELDRIRAEGLLPVAAAADLLQFQLTELLAPQALWYQQALTDLTPQLPRWAEFQASGQTVGDWLRDLYLLPDGSAVQLHWLVGALYKNQQLDYRQLFAPWLAQLLSAAAGVPLQCRLIAAEGCFVLPAYSCIEAQQRLTALLLWLGQSLLEPLPVELQVARQLVLALPEGTRQYLPDDKLWAQLRKIYQGDGYNDGRVQRNPYLARAFANLDLLWQQGRALELALALYAPLTEHLARAAVTEKL